MSIQSEASAVISVNGFLHLHEYFYTKDKAPLELFQSFVITTAGLLVVLHVFKYSYGDSISEQANYGSLARAMEKALYTVFIRLTALGAY